jgi:Restriction Endonuclease associating with ARP
LPQQKDQLNILASFRDEFWEWFRSQHIQLHSDFHHLNSSQAFCFNLFFPLIMENGQGLATLLAMLSVASPPGVGACFEFQPDPNEGTCVDFSLPLQSGARVNFEVKYTESEFGSAKADNSHLQKFKSIYAA